MAKTDTKKKPSNPVLFIRLPKWLHEAVAKEADVRGESLSTVAREVLVARFASQAAK